MMLLRNRLKRMIADSSDKVLSIPHISEDGAEALADYLVAEDMVAVVRCKNCKRWTPDGGHGLDLDGSKQLYGKCVLTNMAIKENNFCSFGAERTGK